MIDESSAAVVSLHVFGTPKARAALRLMTTERAAVRRVPGCTFAKLLGTGSGSTFTARDADPHHWAVLACWSDPDGPERFERSAAYRSWSAISDERARFLLLPLASRGTWSGRTPFATTTTRPDGPVAAITRARIRIRHWPAFWRAVPAVSTDLHAGTGVRFALGIGEAPIGLQGTFSVWDDAQALADFAYRRSPHQEVVRKTAELGWYAEELFARFTVLEMTGSYRGSPLPPTL